MGPLAAGLEGVQTGILWSGEGVRARECPAALGDAPAVRAGGGGRGGQPEQGDPWSLPASQQRGPAWEGQRRRKESHLGAGSVTESV